MAKSGQKKAQRGVGECGVCGMTNCFLHIGTGKTGTTSIQRFMTGNRDALRARGYLFPHAPGNGRQQVLTLYARNATHWPLTRIREASRVIDYASLERNFLEELQRYPVPNVV